MVVTNDTARAQMRLISGDGFLSLIADPVGAATRFETERIDFRPGDRIEWIVGSSLPMSAVFVRPRSGTGGDDRNQRVSDHPFDDAIQLIGPESPRTTRPVSDSAGPVAGPDRAGGVSLLSTEDSALRNGAGRGP